MTVYHGVREFFRPVALDEARRVLSQKHRINSPYLLFVGSFVPRKNIIRILKAFYQFRQEVKSDLKLVLVGQKAWGAEEVNRTIEQWQLRDHVIELNYIADHDLPLLYSGADVGGGQPTTCADHSKTSNAPERNCLPFKMPVRLKCFFLRVPNTVNICGTEVHKGRYLL